MIKLEELKKVIEPIIKDRDDVSDIISQITALDTNPETDVTEAVNAATKKLNEEWNDKFINTFFGGVSVENDEVNVDDSDDDDNEDVDDLNTYENLFSEVI